MYGGESYIYSCYLVPDSIFPSVHLKVCDRSRSPVWSEAFHFLVRDPTEEMLIVKVIALCTIRRHGNLTNSGNLKIAISKCTQTFHSV